ncbi:hypothetical protein CORC01_09923 [Colletotrichum orchidophilum]|uniref:Uncharacterized protein n=1 Tax=Colletotrichum orchidophilum TaxID=1209926 RepID=A0A1G4B0C5_9PEZI|nr:uncharacterized protein CORC01_09923 [Colletotrichum orchidophilum]OHE94816.1 hypothetical protein CORC01_09923 [Colletotrichum orchidophilum]
MDSHDESLFGSPPTSPKSQSYFAVRDPTPLFLPGMSSSPLPNANIAPAQAQSAISNSPLPHLSPQALSTENNASELSYGPKTPAQRLPSQETSQASSSQMPSTTRQAPLSAINPGVAVRLVPTLPHSAGPQVEAPLLTSPFSIGRSTLPPLPESLLLSPSPTASNEIGTPSPSGNGSLAPKKCSKCLKFKPQSEFISLTHMGLTKHRSQCDACRKKRRELSARNKRRKRQAEAEDEQEPQQQQQLPQVVMAQSPLPGSNKDQLPRSCHPSESLDSSGQVTQPSLLGHGVATQSTMLGFGSTVQPLRDHAVPPQPLITTQHAPIDLTSPITTPFTDWSRAHGIEYVNFNTSFNSPHFSMLTQNLQGVDLDADMAYHGPQSSEHLLSPSSVLPQQTGKNTGDANAQANNEDLYNIVSVKMLKTPLTKGDKTSVLDHERQKFKEARHKCQWMKMQDDKTVQAYWEKRHASVVLGLLEVPPPDLQPFIGYSYTEGSHQNLSGAYPDDHNWH